MTATGAGRSIVVLALLLFSYVLLRANGISFTHDEALTYLHGIRPGLEPLLRFDFVDANNHPLNTLLGFFSAWLLGPGELALRLPNVAAYAVYLWASAALARRLENPVFGFCAFALLNLQPFVLDFFSLSRGYGLALGCTMASLWMFLRSESADPGRARLGAGVWAAFAVLANLAFLNFYLALAAVDLAGDAWRRFGPRGERTGGGPGWFRRNGHWIGSGTVLAVVLAPLVLRLQERDAFYLGGTRGFWSDTVGTLVEKSLYGAPVPDAFVPLGVGVVAMVVLLAAALVLVSGMTPGRSRNSELASLLGVIVVAATGTWLQHVLLGTRFLEGRTGLFFLPLFTLLWIYGLDALRSVLPGEGRRLARVGFLASSGAAVVLTAFAFNLSHTYGWRCDADTRDLVDALEKDYAALGAFPMALRIGSDWRQAPVLDYYRVTRQLAWLERPHRHGPNPAYEYEFVGTGDRERLCDIHRGSASAWTGGRDRSPEPAPKVSVIPGAEAVARFAVTDAMLYRRADLEDLARHYKRGLRFQHAGRVESARREFARALDLHPHHLGTLHALARLEAQSGFRDRALQTWRNARVVDPYYPPAWIEAAELEFAAGDSDEALRLLRKVQVPGFYSPRVVAFIAALDARDRAEKVSPPRGGSESERRSDFR